ncbi:MAG: glycosyltransferase [Myxococcota bacterium]
MSPASVRGTTGPEAPLDLVSIVIPCFNAERWLGAAIDSALAQTWPAIEVVVVDDGSTDGSVAVARSYGDRVTVKTGPNRGPSSARNDGLALAKGSWIQFLDSDDLLLPRKVEACLAAVGADRRVVPFARLLPFGGRPRGRWAGLTDRLKAAPPPFDPTRPIVSALRHETQTNQPLYPASVLREIGGFRPGMRWLEDIDLNLRVVLAGAPYVPVDETLVLLRDHAEPGRQRLHPGAALGRIQGEQWMMASVREAGRWDPEVAETFADRLAYVARQAWLAGHHEAAEQAFALARSLARHPRPTGVPLYNAAARWLGFERTERWLAKVRRT